MARTQRRGERDERKVTQVTTDTAERTLSTLSDSLESAGTAAHSIGLAVRDRFRDSASAVDRGGRVLRTSGISGAAAAAALNARRHRKALIGTLGAITGGLLAFGVVIRVFAGGGRS